MSYSLVLDGEHIQGTLTILGIPHMVDSVEIIPGHNGCEDETIAHLSPMPEAGDTDA